MHIEKITQEEATEIIRMRTRHGLFWLEEHGIYVGIDNTTGDAWVEDFHTFKRCERWLKRA